MTGSLSAYYRWNGTVEKGNDDVKQVVKGIIDNMGLNQNEWEKTSVSPNTCKYSSS